MGDKDIPPGTTPPSRGSLLFERALRDQQQAQDDRQKKLREDTSALGVNTSSVRGAWETIAASSSSSSSAAASNRPLGEGGTSNSRTGSQVLERAYQQQQQIEEERKRKLRESTDVPISTGTVKGAWETIASSFSSSSSRTEKFKENPDETVSTGKVRGAWETISSAFSSSNRTEAEKYEGSKIKGSWETVMQKQQMSEQERRASHLKSELDPLTQASRIKVKSLVGEWENVIMQNDSSIDDISNTARVGLQRLRQMNNNVGQNTTKTAAGMQNQGQGQAQPQRPDSEVFLAGSTRVYKLSDVFGDSATANNIQRSLTGTGGVPVILPCGVHTTDTNERPPFDVTAVAIQNEEGVVYVAMTINVMKGATMDPRAYGTNQRITPDPRSTHFVHYLIPSYQISHAFSPLSYHLIPSFLPIYHLIVRSRSSTISRFTKSGRLCT